MFLCNIFFQYGLVVWLLSIGFVSLEFVLLFLLPMFCYYKTPMQTRIPYSLIEQQSINDLA